ncbi:M56 family metallopeptidase [Paenibacillus sp. HB172176]|uniref:M56 family metallopeptidase n=1 Tax=Paenibacillus sp. HB172176 TaxID=2493690 RepID=UPI0014387F88|nr:M56 family metallopeptidase [Paenibacillus sp. HB172176]
MNELTSLFIMILNMSITATYVAVGVMMIRLLLRKLPKIYSYALWSAVLFRLVTPFTITAAISLLGFLHGSDQGSNGEFVYVPQSIGMMSEPQIHTGAGSTVDSSVNQILPEPQITNSVNGMQIFMSAVSWIWLIGVAGLLVYHVASYWRLTRMLRTATKVSSTANRIFESDRIQSPFVLGFFKPAIYVPIGIEENELRHIAAHEEIHIRRRDYWVKPIAYLAVIMHWFNPLMWLSFALMSKDMEMSCDEAAVRKLGLEERRDYSRTLLSLVVKKHTGLRGIPLSFGEHHISSRIKSLLRYESPGSKAAAIGVLAVVICIIMLIVNPGSTEPSDDNGHPGTASSSKDAQNAVRHYQIDELLSNQTDYIGDNSKVAALIASLPAVPGIERGTFSLQTEQQPYELTIHYKINQDEFSDQRRGAAEIEVYRNAVILFSLIGNAGQINNVILYDDEESNGSIQPASSQISYTREQIEKLLFQDVRVLAEDKPKFTEFLRRVSQLGRRDGSSEWSIPVQQSIIPLTNILINNPPGSLYFVRVELTDGSIPVADGWDFAGNFQLRVRNPALSKLDNTTSIYTQLSNDFDQEILQFADRFDLLFADYNGDGDLDFTLGQRVSDENSVYQLYTLSDKGEIMKLETEGALLLHGRNPSVKFEKAGNTGFIVDIYDEQSQTYQKKQFHWNGAKFVLYADS